MKTLVLLFLLFPVSILNAQQAGIPDSTFSADGKLATAMPSPRNGTVKGVVIQPDGKVVLGGYSNNGNNTDFTIVRYHPNGVLDSSLNNTGILQMDFDSSEDVANAMSMDVSGEKIVIGGYMFNGATFDFALAQHNLDGTLDTTFGVHGKLTTSFGGTAFGNALAVQDDGKIILAGYSLQSTNEFALARYLPDGILDSAFGAGGKVLTGFAPGASIGRCIVIQPDGKIVVAGETANDSTFRWEIALARYHADGTLDSAFSDNGKINTASGNFDHNINAIGLQTDGKIVLAGYLGTSPSTNKFLLVRYHPNGTIDSTFGTDGFLTVPFGAQNNQASALLIQPDDKMIVGGNALVNGVNHFALMRFSADGTIDSTFGTNGKTAVSIGSNDGITAMAHDADWKIVTAGSAFHGAGFDFAAARYLNDSVPNTGMPLLHHLHLKLSPNPVLHSATLQFTLQREESVSIHLLDLNGKAIHSFFQHKRMRAGTHAAQLSFPQALTAGAYIILVSSPSGVDAVKAMKQ